MLAGLGACQCLLYSRRDSGAFETVHAAALIARRSLDRHAEYGERVAARQFSKYRHIGEAAAQVDLIVAVRRGDDGTHPPIVASAAGCVEQMRPICGWIGQVWTDPRSLSERCGSWADPLQQVRSALRSVQIAGRIKRGGRSKPLCRFDASAGGLESIAIGIPKAHRSRPRPFSVETAAGEH